MSATSRDTTWIGHEFDRRAATYDESEMHRWQADQAVRLLRPQPAQRILDIATGTGLAARACVRITHAPQRIVGIDVSHGMLQAAAAVSTSSYLQADAAQLPFRPATFDALLCIAAIPYFPDVAQAVTEWRRVAQPGADLVFTTPAADGIATLRLIRQAAADHGLVLPDPHASLGSTDQIAETLDSLGLLLRQAEEHTYPDTLDADPRTAYDRVLEYGFADQLRNAPPATFDAVYDSFQSAYRERQAAGTAQHVTMFTRCSFPAYPGLAPGAEPHSRGSASRSAAPSPRCLLACVAAACPC